MDDANRVKLSYEELGRPEVDLALTEIKQQKKRVAVQANAGIKDARVRALKRLLLLALAGLLSLVLLLSLFHFGKSWISGKLGQQEQGSGDASKSPSPGKSKRI
jgi:hypothetical protein